MLLSWLNQNRNKENEDKIENPEEKKNWLTKCKRKEKMVKRKWEKKVKKVLGTNDKENIMI